MERSSFRMVVAALAALPFPASATVQITALTPSRKAPQLIGSSIVWAAQATDSNPGPLAFRFNVAAPHRALRLVKDFNLGALQSGTWKAQPFDWVPTGIEGTYQIQVVVKDFTSGESAAKTVSYSIQPLVTGSLPVAAPTANPLVALFSAPACPAGSSMRVSFQAAGSTAATTTNYVSCHPPNTMTFEIAGMYPSTTYQMLAQTDTGGIVTNGPAVTFSTGALPGNIPFPTFTVDIPPGPNSDTTDSVLLLNSIRYGNEPVYPSLATDLAGNVVWYYYPGTPQSIVLTRPLRSGMLTIQTGPAWNPASHKSQFLRQIDLAGNIVRETNTGIIQQELLALGAGDGGPCSAIPTPAPVGAACLGSFYHDAIQTLPSGYTAVLADVEKIFPPGTQGDTSGLPVDVIGDMIVVLNANWQVVWYFDTFQHDSGPPQLDIKRAAVLGETCVSGKQGCPPLFLLSSGTAPEAKDWLHANSLYYWPPDNDLLWSSRNQDWVMRVDYNNGAGTGNIQWRAGLDGDFTFRNIYNDPYPWFSHQHEVDIESNGDGPLTLFDNGTTRVVHTGGGCCSRGMELTLDENSLQATPVLSQDLGVYSDAYGSGQVLFDGDVFFLAGTVAVSSSSHASFAIQLLPAAGTDSGTQVFNLEGPNSYRAWLMPSLYAPPIT
jgi:arylsulfate sulfotransferase